MQTAGLLFWVVLVVAVPLGGGRDVRPSLERYLPDYRDDGLGFHNVSSTLAAIEELSRTHSRVVSLLHGFRSAQGRPIPVVRIAAPDKQTAGGGHVRHALRPKVLLVSGEHAREFIPVESLLALMQNISRELDPPSKSSRSRSSHPAGPGLSRRLAVLQNLEIYIVPMLNPDGRAWVEENTNYCWRGNARGVDLNRNYDWEFGGPGSSADPNDEEFRGEHAFSEPESKVLRVLAETQRFAAYLSLHSGIQHIYIPFADTASRNSRHSPGTADLMLDVASKMAASQSGFAFGLARELNSYGADGTSVDYMAGVAKIPISLAAEVWGDGDDTTKACFDLFNPRSHTVQSVADSLVAMYYVLLEEVHARRRALRMAMLPRNSRQVSPVLRVLKQRLGLGPLPAAGICFCLGTALWWRRTLFGKSFPGTQRRFWLFGRPRPRVVSLGRGGLVGMPT